MMLPLQRERIEERKTEISSVSSQSDLSLEELTQKQRIKNMKKIKKSSAFKRRRKAKKHEIGQTMKNYREILNNAQNIDTIGEVENESDTDREEDISVTINYYVGKENRKRLDEWLRPKDETYPISTDIIDVGVKKADDYNKWVSAIKALPNSSKRNIPINEYQKLVKKYTLLIKRILKNREEDKKCIQALLENNKHVKNFENEKKITFEFFEFEEDNTIFHVDLLFHLNDHLIFWNAKFDDLPIKYAITSIKFEIYGIWFDQSLKMEIARHAEEIRSKLLEK
jgi:hypothetical protein